MSLLTHSSPFAYDSWPLLLFTKHARLDTKSLGAVCCLCLTSFSPRQSVFLRLVALPPEKCIVYPFTFFKSLCNVTFLMKPTRRILFKSCNLPLYPLILFLSCSNFPIWWISL